MARSKTNAQYVAEHMARRAELGDLPEVVDPARRERCRLSLLDFGLTYAMGDHAGAIIKRPPGERMLPYIEALQGSYLADKMVHVRLPRGMGKTAWEKIGGVWAACYGHRRFMCIFGANQVNADQILDDIWQFCEDAPLFGEDFPEVAIPIRALDGRMQRCAVQTHHGERTKIKKSADRIVFPRIDGAACSGIAIVSRGKDAGVRGLARGSSRPDHIIIDDPQTRETARSDGQSETIAAWIQGDILGLAGHDRAISACMATTPIYSGDISDQYADPDLHPEWSTISLPLVISWPTATHLWDEYLELRRRDEIAEVANHANATAYYADHRAEMDAGAVMLDDAAFDQRSELSAVQHAFNLLFKLKEAAFEAEYMLSPKKSSAAFVLSAKMVSANITGGARLTLPDAFHGAVAFVDCMSRDSLRWSIVGIGPQRQAVVCAYGRYPEGSAPLFPEGSLVPEQNKILAQALNNIIEMICATPIRKPGGAALFVSAVGIDAGWRPRIVEWLAARHKRKDILYPSVGFGWNKFAPVRIDGKPKNGVTCVGDHCYMAQSNGVRRLGQHSDFWKEYAQRSFLAPPLTPGATGIYGRDPLEHYDFACEITAETLADKGIGSNGTEFWRFVRRPGARNHYLDCVSGCLMLASWLRLYDAGQVLAGSARPEAKKQVIRRHSRVKLVRN